MPLISVEDYRLALEQALAAVPPAVADGLLLRRPGLAEAEIARAERALGLGPLPASFTGLLATYDFGNFACWMGQFGGCPGSAEWLLRANDPAAFGFETFGQELRQQALLVVAIGDPFAILLEVPTGCIFAIDDELPLAGRLPVAGSFLHFMQGVGTAYVARRQHAEAAFWELASREFGAAALPFWHELTQ